MKTLAATLFLSAFAAAQDAVPAPAAAKITGLNRYEDGSCGGVLEDHRGALRFHLAFTAYHADLWVGVTRNTQPGARRIEPGSVEEKDVISRLLAWSRGAFDDDERASIEAADDVHHRGSGWTFDRYKEAAVVNRLAHYRRIRGARITNVFRGKGTVVVSFKVRDGLGREQLVLFRSVNDAYARPHLADSVEPVVEGSTDERWIVQAIHAYTEAQIKKDLLDLVWSGAEIALSTEPREAVDVVFALINYMNNTSPRLVNLFRLRDGGSVTAVFVGIRGHRFDVFFDSAIGSKTKGRIKWSPDGRGEHALVEFGSPEEQAVLTQLERYLNHHEDDVKADGNKTAKTIAERLEHYRDLKQRAGR